MRRRARAVDEVVAVCEKWQVNATAIGEVTDSRRLRVFDGDALVGDMPVTALVDECPVYDLEPVAPERVDVPARREPVPGLPADPGGLLLALLGQRQPRLAPLGVRAVRLPRRLAHRAPARRRPTPPCCSCPGGSAIAVSIDGNGRRVACDPYRGAVEAVLECSANLACVGAEPLGLTNCLNFGNPEKPHIAWQLSRAVAGLADACRALGIPVVGGNVSLYNEAGAGPIFPTPVVGMVGELPKAARSGRLGFAEEGDVVAVISAGSWAPAAMGSELAKLRGEAPFGELPQADLGELRALHAAVRQAVRAGALRSAHDVAEGGLAVALAEACLAGGLGATVDLSPLRPAGEALLFGEGPGAFVVSGPEQSLRAFGAAAVAHRHGRRRRSRHRRRAQRAGGRAVGRPRGRPRGPALGLPQLGARRDARRRGVVRVGLVEVALAAVGEHEHVLAVGAHPHAAERAAREAEVRPPSPLRRAW